MGMHQSKIEIEFDRFKKIVAVVIIIISIGCAVGIWQGREAASDAEQAANKANSVITSFKIEAKGRRDESCTITEREHLNDVDNLKETYKYLDALTPIEVSQTLNQFIIANLNDVEETARTDVAPSYCDEPGIGLAEPDPVLPIRRDFSHLLIIKEK